MLTTDNLTRSDEKVKIFARARTTPVRKATRALAWLGVIIIGLAALNVLDFFTSSVPKGTSQAATFAPKLGLDLIGGTAGGVSADDVVADQRLRAVPVFGDNRGIESGLVEHAAERGPLQDHFAQHVVEVGQRRRLDQRPVTGGAVWRTAAAKRVAALGETTAPRSHAASSFISLTISSGGLLCNWRRR